MNRRFSAITILIALPIVVLAVPQMAFAGERSVSISANGAERFQTMLGFGAALAPWEVRGNYNRHDKSYPEVLTGTENQKREIARLLYTQLGIQHARLFLGGYEPTNDNDDPMTFNQAAYDWQAIEPYTDFVLKARPEGLKMWWLTFSVDGAPTESWLRLPGNNCTLDSAKVDEDVEWILAAVLHFRDLDILPEYITINNEPDFGYCSNPMGYKISVDDYVTITKRLGKRLKDNGLTSRIVAVDGLNPQGSIAYVRALLADPEAKQYLAALAYHSYADAYPDPEATLNTSGRSHTVEGARKSREEIRDLGAQAGLPIWMTEVCICDPPRNLNDFQLGLARLNHVHDELTIANVSVFDAMNLYFIERPGVRDELVHVYFNKEGSLERSQIAPYGYMLGHYAHFLPSGAVRIAATSSDAEVHASAFVRPDGGLVLVVLNNTQDSVKVELSLQGLDKLPAALTQLISQNEKYWQQGESAPVHDGRVTVTLLPFSVTTLTGHAG